jgi:hypothetical protein
MNRLTHDLGASTQAPIDEIDAQEFRACFNRKPFKIHHRLADHPLFALPRLIELAQHLPQHRIEYNAGNLPVSQDPASTPLNGLSVEETIHRIEECNSWMVLKNVELDDEYRGLLDECLEIIKPHSEPIAAGMYQREAFIFVSSPGSVTPFHIDPENNFLLQVRGTKQVELFDAGDRAVLAESDIEGFFSGAHRNLIYRPEFAGRGQIFDLVPGEGLHFPVIAPHWVRNGPAVSISFSITFRTANSESRAALYRLNNRLRRFGLRPSIVGQSPVRDTVKLGAIGLVQSLKRRLKRGENGSSPTRY